MARLKRSSVIKLMEACGFSSAPALSTSRLEKKLNRLDRVSLPKKLDTDELTDQLNFVLECIKNGERVQVDDDRPQIPNDERPAPPKKRYSKSGGGGMGRAPKASKYDWPTILNGKVNVCEQGSDYDCKSSAFALQVRSAARRKGIKVRVSVQKGQVIVQALGK